MPSTTTTPNELKQTLIGWRMAGLVALGAMFMTTDPTVTEPVHLTASLSQRQIVIQSGDSTITYAIAVGKDNKPTPTGTFTIRKIVWNPDWVPPAANWAKGKKPEAPGSKNNPMRVVKIYFKEPDYYIHGTDQVESLGEAASHGCLRMHPDDAYNLARFLMEHGGQPRDENWFWRVMHSRSEMKTVYLDNPATLTISE